MDILSLVADIVLLVGGIMTMYYAIQVGGSIGHKSLQFMAAGFFILGLAHISETFMFRFFPQTNIELLEFLHRVIVLIGSALIVIAYRRLAKFVRS